MQFLCEMKFSPNPLGSSKLHHINHSSCRVLFNEWHMIIYMTVCNYTKIFVIVVGFFQEVVCQSAPSYPYNTRETPERKWHQMSGIYHKANNDHFTSTTGAQSPTCTFKPLLVLCFLSQCAHDLNAEWNTHTHTRCTVHWGTRKWKTPVLHSAKL